MKNEPNPMGDPMGNNTFSVYSFRRIAAVTTMALVFGLIEVTCDKNPDGPTDPADDNLNDTLDTGDIDTVTDSIGDTAVVYGDSILTHSPLKFDSIAGFVPLGNLNPPGHTFPTDHSYLYLANNDGSDTPPTQTLFCPGRLRISAATASEHVSAGFTDYSILFDLGDSVTMQLGHVSSLAETVFGDVSTLTGWDLVNEYSTGGETYRMWSKNYDTVIEAGEIIGTAGGNANQYALDIGVYDWHRTNGTPANSTVWQGSRQLRAFCPLDYYEPGMVLDSLNALSERTYFPDDNYPCGWVVQDVTNSAQGVWFKPGEPAPYPEDPHLALVWHNLQGDQQAFSIGNSLTTVSSGIYVFEPLTSGRLNRRFDQVTSDGSIYGYTVGGVWGGNETTILIRLTDSVTMEIEGFAGHQSDSTAWAITGARSLFER